MCLLPTRSHTFGGSFRRTSGNYWLISRLWETQLGKEDYCDDLTGFMAVCLCFCCATVRSWRRSQCHGLPSRYLVVYRTHFITSLRPSRAAPLTWSATQLLYASSKVMIYLFLMERLAIVHGNVTHVQGSSTMKERFSSWWYRVAFGLLIFWLAVAIDMCFARNTVLFGNGKCYIGIKIWGTVPILVVDFAVNVFLTAGFLKPVYKAGFGQAERLVKDSCLAACLALTTSFANILILSIMHGTYCLTNAD